MKKRVCPIIPGSQAPGFLGFLLFGTPFALERERERESSMLVWALLSLHAELDELVSLHATEELAWNAVDELSLIDPGKDLDVREYKLEQE